MNFIGVVTIAAPRKLQESSISMETPSLTAASAGSAANFASAAGRYKQFELAAATAGLLAIRSAGREALAAPGFRAAAPGTRRHQPIPPAGTMLLRNGRLLGRLRKQTSHPGDASPHRLSGMAPRSSTTAAG